MTNYLYRHWKTPLTLLLGIAVFFFWWKAYPHALSYQEQYQLFLWTPQYFSERVAVPGGLADWLGELVVQFYYVEWLGAFLLSLFFMLLQRLVWASMKSHALLLYPLSFIPCVLLLWSMGDASVLLGYGMALAGVLTFSCLTYLFGLHKGRKPLLWAVVADVVLIPLVYWLFGGLVWLYVCIRTIHMGGRSWLWTVIWMGATFWMASIALPQWPMQQIIMPIAYYRIPLQCPWTLSIIPLVVFLLCTVAAFWKGEKARPTTRIRKGVWTALLVETAAVAGFACWLVPTGFDKDTYALIRQDYLVRNQRWDDIIKEAADYQVRTPFSSVCVNLALSKKRLLADRMFDFYQSGDDALIMHSIGDLTSNMPSMEALWHLGMVNATQRYAFNLQGSILNAKRSGRLTRRIAQCMLANGHYQTARKQLQWLSQSLFYRQWANEQLAALQQEGDARERAILSDADIKRVRSLRFKSDFLFSIGEPATMFGLLFNDNHQNLMALDYFLAQHLLSGNLPAFQQYLAWAQQYGGYRQMPLGYQDVMRCIQNNGNVSDSPYRNYVKRMTGQ